MSPYQISNRVGIARDTHCSPFAHTTVYPLSPKIRHQALMVKRVWDQDESPWRHCPFNLPRSSQPIQISVDSTRKQRKSQPQRPNAKRILSPTGDLYDVLVNCLRSVGLEVTSVNLADMSHVAFCSLTTRIYCWVFPNHSRHCRKSQSHPHRASVSKFRLLFRCATRLYHSIRSNEPPKSRQKFAESVSFQCWLLPQTKEKSTQTTRIIAVRRVEEEGILSYR
jgi:hypothetical protein